MDSGTLLLLLFLSHLPFLPLLFLPHAETVISVEKCDVRIVLGTRATRLGALRVGVMNGFFFVI